MKWFLLWLALSVAFAIAYKGLREFVIAVRLRREIRLLRRQTKALLIWSRNMEEPKGHPWLN